MLFVPGCNQILGIEDARYEERGFEQGEAGVSVPDGTVMCARDSDCGTGRRCISGTCTTSTGEGGMRPPLTPEGGADVDPMRPDRDTDPDGSMPPVQDECEALRCDANARCVEDSNAELFCQCRQGFEPREGTCEDRNECMQADRGGCSENADCQNTVGGRTCTCRPGFVDVNEDGSVCTPVCDLAGCLDEVASCSVVAGEAVCACLPEYIGDGKQSCDLDTACINLGCDEATEECQVDGTERRCACRAGYERQGDRCVNPDDCDPQPCENDGTCTDALGGFVCECPAGFSGPTCGTNINECDPDPCRNGGTCFDGIDDYECRCEPGYIGKNCQTDEDNCAGAPCRNGGECRDGVDEYTCLCEGTGFEGTNCDEPIDDCSPNQCANDGVCTDGVNTFTCSCPMGWAGPTCEINAPDCDPNPCQNMGSCVDGVASYTCSCPDGFSGNQCEINDPDCDPNPCQNSAACTDLVNDYVCACPEGFDGKNCEVNRNECLPDPCQNGGRCVDGIADYECVCTPGFTGKDCQTDIYECEPEPCRNGGVCTDLVNGYECDCAGTGFEGDNCEINEDNCSPNPCEYGGTCRDGINEFTCRCADGYDGPTCGNNIDDCSPEPCENGGTCTDLVAGYTCACVDGYVGTNCQTDANNCEDEPCQNGAECVDLVGDFECTCAEGYEGDLCETNTPDCAADTCQNEGTCIDLVAGYFCQCPAGWVGDNCETNFDECASGPCNNGGQCTDRVNGFDCSCDNTGYVGATCQNDRNECIDRTVCGSDAACVNTEGSFRCEPCANGYESSLAGTSCEDINECLSNPCLNGGGCDNLPGSYECRCATGFDGTNCENNINECTSRSVCGDSAYCRDTDGGYDCVDCGGGLESSESGLTCIDIRECESDPCLNGGRCVEQIGSYECICTGTNYQGLNCEVDVNECTGRGVCGASARCVNLPGTFRCDPCGTGSESLPNGLECRDINECLQRPCQNGGECINETPGFRCECQGTGFGGERCQADDDECTGRGVCGERASCRNIPGGFVCDDCNAGFESSSDGLSCVDVDECTGRNVCGASAYCDNRNGGYDCVDCPPGREADTNGLSCRDIDECLTDPCLNSGSCTNTDGSYFCTCPEGWEGDNCERDVNECTGRSVCGNVQRCLNSAGGYQCIPCAGGEQSSSDGLSCVCAATVSCWPDNDGDGYAAVGSSPVAQCGSCGANRTSRQPSGVSNIDCNDGNGNVRPGVTDDCDGVDTDCDGTPDDDYVDSCVNDGQRRACIDGRVQTPSCSGTTTCNGGSCLGQCRRGQTRCVAGSRAYQECDGRGEWSIQEECFSTSGTWEVCRGGACELSATRSRQVTNAADWTETGSLSSNRWRVVAVDLPYPMRIDQLAVQLSGISSSFSIRLILLEDRQGPSATSTQPGSLIASTSNFGVRNGVNQGNLVGGSREVSAGRYWIGVNASASGGRIALRSGSSLIVSYWEAGTVFTASERTYFANGGPDSFPGAGEYGMWVNGRDLF